MRLDELVSSEKAGFMPYFYDNGTPVFYFMIPSDSKYGGPQPAIAKGHVEKGETTIAGAYREAAEELGLKLSNINLVTVELGWKGEIQGKKEVYTMSVYTGEIYKKNNFKTPTYETSRCVWLTAKEFSTQGRKSQVAVVNAVNRLLIGKH